MGSSSYNFGQSAPFILQGMLEDVAVEAAKVIQQACSVDAVLIWLPETASGVGPTDPHGDNSDAELVQALRDFLEVRCAEGVPTQLGGLGPYHSAAHEDYIFTMVPLYHEGDAIGVASVAVQTRAWNGGTVFASLSKVCDLAATLLATARAKYQLEADLAEANRRAKRLMQQAEVDDLTQVQNKAAFENKARARLQSSKRPAAFLALDLDDFKQVNDVFGHQFGDDYLRAVARALCEGLPPSAIVGRTGGDEFCVLIDMPETGKNYLMSVVHQVRLSIRKYIAKLGSRHQGQMSIGICHFPSQANAYDDLVKKADQALYVAKRRDKNETVTYKAGLPGTLPDGEAMENGMPNLRRFAPYFQPIVDMGQGRRVGLELLARWLSDDPLQVRGPQTFGWMFRDARFASALTLEIVGRALAQLSDLPQFSDGLPDLWINVTDCDLMSPEFVFDLQNVFAPYNVGWDGIVIEVNEASMLSDREGQLFHTLQELRCRGARVALDDFGTGHAGLMHLNTWPIDIIKIDQSFVKRVDLDKGARVVVDALMMIARTVGLKVVAEGVETQGQLEAMQNAGCDFAQGFLLDIPKPAMALVNVPEYYDLASIRSLAC